MMYNKYLNGIFEELKLNKKDINFLKLNNIINKINCSFVIIYLLIMVCLYFKISNIELIFKFILSIGLILVTLNGIILLNISSTIVDNYINIKKLLNKWENNNNNEIDKSKLQKQIYAEFDQGEKYCFAVNALFISQILLNLSAILLIFYIIY